VSKHTAQTNSPKIPTAKCYGCGHTHTTDDLRAFGTNDAGEPEVFIPNGREGDNGGRNDGGYMSMFSQGPLRIGDELSEWTVVGVLPAVLASAFVPREAWVAATGDTLLGRAVVALADSGVVAASATRRTLHATLADSGYQLGSTLVSENRAAVEDHLLLVADFLSAMGWLMLLVGGLGLASTMSLAVLERTREIGVLRAIGARHGSIHLIVQAGWLVAIPLSIPMARIPGDAFGRIFFKTPIALVPDPRGIVLWLGVVVVVSVAACAWPAFRATRVSARVALSYE